MVQKNTRKFAEDILAEWAPILDREQRTLPDEIFKEMGELGYMGIQAPSDYGGAALDSISYSIIIEELSRICGSTGLTVSVHNSVCLAPILKFGTELQKEKFIPDMASGKNLGGFAATEPNAGSDASGIRTTAIKDGNDYIINGQKTFITNGGNGDIFVVSAKTDRKSGTRGISAFIVEKKMDGFKVGKIEEKLGMRGNLVSELYFDNIAVPAENMLGKLGSGFKIIMQTLDIGRIGIASQALGIGMVAFEAAAKYASQRFQFGKAIGKFQGIMFKLAEMKADLEASRLLIYKAAHLKDKGLPFSEASSICKLYASDKAMKACREALQIFGGYGYIKDLPVERYFRDVKVTEIYEGTSEIMKLIIGTSILKALNQ